MFLGFAGGSGDDAVETHGIVPEESADVLKGIIFCGIDPDVIVQLAQVVQQSRDTAADALFVKTVIGEGQGLFRGFILSLTEDDLVQIQRDALVVTLLSMRSISVSCVRLTMEMARGLKFV